MESSKIIPKFIKFNENPDRCSAWLKGKERCCRRRIAAVDQKRRDSLCQSNSRARIKTEEAEEMVNLYFCNGWHRPGGKHPIPYSERDKVLQVLFPNTPEPANRDATASHLREPRAPSFPETRFSEIYGSTLLIGRSAGQYSRRTPQTPATNRRQEQRAPSVTNESEAPLEVANQIL